MNRNEREEEQKKFEEQTSLHLDQVKKRMNRYFLSLEKAIFSKTTIPYPDESEPGSMTKRGR